MSAAQNKERYHYFCGEHLSLACLTDFEKRRHAETLIVACENESGYTDHLLVSLSHEHFFRALVSSQEDESFFS